MLMPSIGKKAHHILISSFIFSHPGDAADPIEYEIHLPEASAPVVMFLGVVDGRNCLLRSSLLVARLSAVCDCPGSIGLLRALTVFADREGHYKLDCSNGCLWRLESRAHQPDKVDTEQCWAWVGLG